jgi:hypothetical protein
MKKSSYSLDETAEILSRSREDIESLIRQRRIGFEMREHSLVITERQIADFYLGNKPRSLPEYKPEGCRKKSRKRYVKSRTRR